MNDTNYKARHAAELRFAMRVRQALNETTANLSPARLEQLAAARKAALRSQKFGRNAVQWATQPAFSGPGGAAAGPFGASYKHAVIVLGLALLVGAAIAGIFAMEEQRRIDELADIDAALLTDEVPLSAYADHGFNAYLKQNP